MTTIHPQRVILAKGVIRTIFLALDEKKLSNRDVARELDVWPSRIAQWRRGQREPPLFFIQCLADLAGYEFVLTPKEKRK